MKRVNTWFSGKLLILDHLLQKLHTARHRVLLFSQMTHTLDILQDYLELRKYTYECLDGSVRVEEHFGAIRRFSEQPVKDFSNSPNDHNGAFVFLISTGAGGVGLNLVGADTVIFYEQDWNPQVDKQALQRVHRIGQINPVLSINLVTGRTVEEVIMRRAERKLQLSHNVVGEDDMSYEHDEMGADVGDLRSVIFGLHMFDPTVTDQENPNEVNTRELISMAEKVTKMRHELSDNQDRKFELNPMDVLRGEDFSMKNTPAYDSFDPGLDEASHLSWVEKFKEASEFTDNSNLVLSKRNLPVERTEKLEAAKRKAEEKKLLKWDALGYQSLAITDVPVSNVDGDMLLNGSGSVQFVYGDCTVPSKVCPSEPAIIFRRRWDSGGIVGWVLGSLTVQARKRD